MSSASRESNCAGRCEIQGNWTEALRPQGSEVLWDKNRIAEMGLTQHGDVCWVPGVLGGGMTNKEAHHLGVFAQREALSVMSWQAACRSGWGITSQRTSHRQGCRVVWLRLEGGEDPTVAAKSSRIVEVEDWADRFGAERKCRENWNSPIMKSSQRPSRYHILGIVSRAGRLQQAKVIYGG